MSIKLRSIYYIAVIYSDNSQGVTSVVGEKISLTNWPTNRPVIIHPTIEFSSEKGYWVQLDNYLTVTDLLTGKSILRKMMITKPDAIRRAEKYLSTFTATQIADTIRRGEHPLMEQLKQLNGEHYE